MSCKLFFTGDVVLKDETCLNFRGGWHLVSDELRQRIEKSDLAICNFEGPIIKNFAPKKKVGPNIQNDKCVADALKADGFNMALLANNHVFDYGTEGIENTVNTLKDCGFITIGAGTSREDIYRPYIHECDNLKIGIINAAENGFGAATEGAEYGYAYIFANEFWENLNELKESCDFVVAIIHAGAEGWDFPLPEWRDTYKKLIDHGANLVVAHHPHVVQGWEEYHGGKIFYSLGNFAFNKGNGPQDACAYALEVNIQDDLTFEHKIIPTKFENGIVSGNDDEAFVKHVDECVQILKDPASYMDAVNSKALQSYEGYKKAYLRVACVYRGNPMEWAKGIIKRFFLEKGFQDIWLYHNISIETHLYICKRATRLKLQDKNIL